MILAGVDIETTGLDPDKHHRIIQIGIATDTHAFWRDIQPEGPIMIDPRALAVNKFTLTRIGKADHTSVVDRSLDKLLSSAGFKRGDLTPVGWNVGGFDMQFINKELPLTAKYFHYRCVDLTALAIFYEVKTGKSYKDLKEDLKKKVVSIFGSDNEHDALWDAQAALVALRLFKEVL